MAQPPGHIIVRVGSERILVPPGPGPAFPLNRLPVRRRRRSLALKSYGGPVGLAGRQPQQQRRRPLQNYVHDVDENVVTSTTPRSPSPTSNAGESREISLTEQVLSNHLIWNIIGRHLSISDLKICRLVSPLFNHHVLNSTNFKDRALVTLTPNMLRPEEFGTTHISWKHISLPLQQVCAKSDCVQSYLHDLSWVIPMLSEVESLILVKGPACPGTTAAISPSPTSMAQVSTKLKDLTVDEDILSYSAFTNFSAQLSRLEVFKLETKSEMSLSTQLHAVEQMLNVTKNLKVFKTTFKLDPAAARRVVVWNIQKMSLLIQQNLATIEILKPRDHLFWSDEFLECQPIMHMKFPLLTSVRICVTVLNGFDVIEFIKAQPKLTQLTLDSFDMGNNVFPNLVLQTVAEISGRLKKLDIKAREFGNLSVRDWKFLRNSKIQDLSIWPWKDRLYEEEAIKGAEFVPQVLKYLPPKVKRVRLQSGFVGSNANSLDCRAMPIYLGQLDPEVLTCLCLSRMAGFITDATLEYIFSNFLMLQELHLSDLDEKVTEFGFTGVSPQRPQQSEFSIENLQGLKRLTVRSCNAISNFSLLKAFKFQELQYLDLRWNPNINVQGCIAVAQQNPSLEVFMNDRMSGFPKEESVRRENFPRLKFLQKSLVKPDIADD